MSASFGSDDWIDARLRDVPLPPGLVARVQSVVPNDEQIDEVLCEVPLPPDLLNALAQIPALHRRRREPQWQRFAVAASIMLAVGASYVVLGWGLVVGLRPAAQVAPPADPSRDGADSPSGPAEPRLPDALAQAADLPPETEADEAALNELFDDRLLNPMPGPAFVVTEPLPTPPVPSLALRIQQTFAANAVADTLPELETLLPSAEHGFFAPRVPGYDLLFHLKHGDHPLVSPAGHPSLASVSPPLSTSTASYVDAWRQLSSGRLPAPDSILTADFLAGVAYDYPAPATGLGIRTAAGPNPLSASKSKLLQVAVKASAAVSAVRAPARLVILLNVSSSMARADRLQIVQQALPLLAEQLQQGDRLTVVACSEASHVLASDVGPGNLSGLLSAVDSLAPSRTANAAVGLEASLKALLAAPETDGALPRIVLLGDGRWSMAPEMAESVRQLVQKVYSAGSVVDVCDVSRAGAADAWLGQLAAAGGGEHRQVSDSVQLERVLVESLSGDRQTVGENVALTVRFNPAVVEKYRLIGHESRTLTGDPASQTVELAQGETATALFEIWLLAGGGDDVATCELTWRDPRTLASQSAAQRISRIQFAKSLREMPLPLAAAAIAAGTAESLRGSFYSSPRGLERVLGVAAQLSDQQRSEPSLSRMIDLANAAARLQPAANGGR